MNPGEKWMRRLVYVYFFLLIFEGALRKWIFPSLAGPLLVVRDPVLLAIYAMALHRGIFPWNRWVLAAIALGLACVLASMAVRCPLVITLYGVRTDFWQVPLIFLMPSILPAADVRRIGGWMLALLTGMALLALLQFRAGPAHWLNATTGGAVSEESRQLYAAAGRVRPSGTFSFVTGMVSFLALGSAFVFETFIKGPWNGRLWAATAAMVLALGISGSRSAILETGLVALVAGVICMASSDRLRRVLVLALAAAMAFVLLYGLADFREGLQVNRSRFDSAGGLQEGIVYRWFGDMVLVWQSEQHAPWLGSGLGMGTNVGAGLATGTRQFLLAEVEWARVILESGPVLGLAFIAFRVGIAVYLLRRALGAWRERDDTLPMLLLAAGVMDLTMGQWGQATISGFAVFTAGLCLASSADGETQPAEPEPVVRKLRGRGIYAESIKGGRE